ncbi:MAG: hypothetical protein IZT58_10950, partial [Actinobacteria bacterium]|nr:hypothetical protein [Actinomycetota bacterium]
MGERQALHRFPNFAVVDELGEEHTEDQDDDDNADDRLDPGTTLLLGQFLVGGRALDGGLAHDAAGSDSGGAEAPPVPPPNSRCPELACQRRVIIQPIGIGSNQLA